MALSDNVDKIVVDRRKKARGGTVSRTIRDQRDKLANRVGSTRLEAEVLQGYAAFIQSAIPLFSLLIVLGGLTLYLSGASAWITIGWACAALALQLPKLALVTFYRSSLKTVTQITRLKRAYMAVHLVAALAWVGFIFIDVPATMMGDPVVLKAVVILVVMAAHASTMSALAGSLFLSLAVPTLAYGVFAWQAAEPIATILFCLLVTSSIFLSVISRRVGRSAKESLQHKEVMTGLVAELETAKSISDEARRRAEEANLAKSRFLASMSHELRTPLNAILGFSEVMAEEVLGPMENQSYKEYASDIRSSGQHLLDLINQILDLSRIEAGRYDLDEQPISLPELIEQCCHMMALKARAKGVTVVQQVEAGMPPILVDERSIRQVLLNLLSNAVKFTPPGGTITVKGGWTTNAGQYLSVSDDGPGIPEDEIPVVLSTFGQGSIAIRHAEQGTGLGLPIVQAIMQAHNGRFILRSKLRVGTTATAIFPKSRVNVASAPSLAPDQSDLHASTHENETS